MSEFADPQTAHAGRSARKRGSTLLVRAPVGVRAMRDLSNQTDGTEPTGSDSTAPSMTWEAMQKDPWLDRGHEMQERAEGTGETIKPRRGIVAEDVELAVGAGRPSLAMGLSSSLSGSLIFNLPLSLSSPLQSLNLRSSSVWLSGAENDLRTWPPGARSSEHYRSRKGACRTPNGRLFGPIGRLFLPSGHDYFGVALGAAGPCVGQACWPKDRQHLAGNQGSSGLRLWLRLSFHPRLHRPVRPEARKPRPQRGLRAWRFADISTQPPHRNIKWHRGNLIVLSISPLAPLALGALAIASAPVPQRFAGSTAPIALGARTIASALATHRLLASALASQRSGSERPRAWRPA
jgi:hypothetical protein